MATKALMTAEEFGQLNTADSEDYELVDGELSPLSSGTPLHNLTRDNFVFHFRIYFRQHPIGGATGETDFRMDRGNVRRPGLSIFLGEKWNQLDLNQTPVPFAPDIAVEVLSPSEHSLEVTRKVREYLSAGSQEVWLLDQANGELQVRGKSGIRLVEAGDVLDSPLLPGFSVAVTELLAGR